MKTNLAYKNWEEPCREEIINGKVVLMSPRPNVDHNQIAFSIAHLFRNYLKGKTCMPFADGTDVYLTDGERYVPDMMVVCDRSKIKRNGVHGAPDLVVEVLSPRSARYDRGHKKDVYARSGVREYWIVDPSARSVEQYLLRDGDLILEAIHYQHPEQLQIMSEEEEAAVETTFRCSLYDDLDIALDDIFEGLLE